MRTLGTVRLFASATESSYAVDATVTRMRIKNLSASPLRISSTTGKVNDPGITDNVVFQEFDTIGPFGEVVRDCGTSFGSLYYAANLAKAPFELELFIA